jgi:hypothetical protein
MMSGMMITAIFDAITLAILAASSDDCNYTRYSGQVQAMTAITLFISEKSENTNPVYKLRHNHCPILASSTDNLT